MTSEVFDRVDWQMGEASLSTEWTSILKHSGAARKCHHSASQRRPELDISVLRWMKSLCQTLGGLLTWIFLIKIFLLPRQGTAKTSESPGRGRFQINLSLCGRFHGFMGRIILSVEDFHPGFQEKVAAALDPLHSGFRHSSGVSWCGYSHGYLGKFPGPVVTSLAMSKHYHSIVCLSQFCDLRLQIKYPQFYNK